VLAETKDDGLGLLKKYGCLECHFIYKNTPKAPPFIAIRNRYMGYYLGNEKEVKKLIKNAVKNGSKGKWLRFKNGMPAIENIPEKDLNKIADYIIKLQPNYFKYYKYY
jgi:cytochrome c551/c552